MDATRASIKTGAGIDEIFVGNNIHQQLQSKIYAYDRLHQLFSKSPHLIPAARVTTANNILRFTTRNKTLNIQQSAVDEIAGQKKGLQNNDECSKNRWPQDDQEDDEELQGFSNHHTGEAFANYRSSAGSTITTSTNSRKRPATSFKDDSGNASGDMRRTLPSSLRDLHPPEKSKASMIDQYIAERSSSVEARIKHEKEMEKDRQEFEMKKEQLRMSHESSQLIGKMMIAGFENNRTADEMLNLMKVYNQIRETQGSA
ncbi:hypothetical protein BGX24_004859, partial [Mortierella sp. AD032]